MIYGKKKKVDIQIWSIFNVFHFLRYANLFLYFLLIFIFVYVAKSSLWKMDMTEDSIYYISPLSE